MIEGSRIDAWATCLHFRERAQLTISALRILLPFPRRTIHKRDWPEPVVEFLNLTTVLFRHADRSVLNPHYWTLSVSFRVSLWRSCKMRLPRL
jgi:hypothetical protein